MYKTLRTCIRILDTEYKQLKTNPTEGLDADLVEEFGDMAPNIKLYEVLEDKLKYYLNMLEQNSGKFRNPAAEIELESTFEIFSQLIKEVENGLEDVRFCTKEYFDLRMLVLKRLESTLVMALYMEVGIKLPFRFGLEERSEEQRKVIHTKVTEEQIMVMEKVNMDLDEYLTWISDMRREYYVVPEIDNELIEDLGNTNEDLKGFVVDYSSQLLPFDIELLRKDKISKEEMISIMESREEDSPVFAGTGLEQNYEYSDVFAFARLVPEKDQEAMVHGITKVPAELIQKCLDTQTYLREEVMSFVGNGKVQATSIIQKGKLEKDS